MRNLALMVGIVALVSARPARAEVVLPALPAVVVADEPAAEAKYGEAMGFTKEKKFVEALGAAELSFKLAPTAKRAAMVGAIRRELGQTRGAFAEFLAALNLRGDGEVEQYATRQLAKLPSLKPADLGIVRFNARPAVARCTLEATGEAFELSERVVAVGLSVGAQKVTCTAFGHEPAEVALRVRGRALLDVDVTLKPIATAVIPEPKPEPEPIVEVKPEPENHASIIEPKPDPIIEKPKPPSDDDTLAIVMLIGGGVLVGTGVGFHVWAGSAVDDANDAATYQDHARYESSKSDAELRQTVAWIGYGLGAGAIATGIILLVQSDDDDSAQLAPLFDGERLGVTWHARF